MQAAEIAPSVPTLVSQTDAPAFTIFAVRDIDDTGDTASAVGVETAPSLWEGPEALLTLSGLAGGDELSALSAVS